MKHIKNICINCEDDGRVVNPARSHVIRYCGHTRYFMLPVIDSLSEAFMKAQMHYEEFTINEPYEVCIVYPNDHKFKKQDPETAIERVEWFINNMREPQGGIKFSLYENENIANFRNSGWYSKYMWETKETWKPNDSNYITMQIREPGKTSEWSTRMLDKCMRRVEDQAQQYGLELVPVSYDMSYEEIYRLLLGTKMHFSYSGATYFLSALARVPTVGMGQPHAQYFQEVGLDNWYFRSNIFHHVGTHPNQHMISRDGVPTNGPVNTTFDTRSPPHIREFFDLALSSPNDFWTNWYKRFYVHQTPDYNSHHDYEQEQRVREIMEQL